MNGPSTTYWLVYDAIQAALGEGEILTSLTICEIPEYKGRQAENKVKQELQAEKDKTKRIKGWENCHSLLRSGDGNLDDAAMVYFGLVDHMGRKWSTENLENHFNEEIATSIIIGFKHRAKIGLSVPVSELGRMRAKHSRNHMETAVVAAVSILMMENDIQALDELSLEAALLVLLNRFFCDDEEHRSELKRWALRKLDRESERASDLLVSFWVDELDARIALKQSNDTLGVDLIHDFSYGETRSKAASMALSKLLAKRHEFPPKVLRSLVGVICHQWDAEKILSICKAVVSDIAVSKENRQVWAAVAFSIAPHEWSKQFHSLFANDGKALAELSDVVETIKKYFPLAGANYKLAYHGAVVEILGPVFAPSGEGFGHRDTVQGSINSLAEITHKEAQKELRRLHDLPTLSEWESNLRHALSNNLRKIRDDTFNHPTMEQVQDALAGGPPINAADLRAVMVEVLRGYQREVIHGDLPAWNGYWNTDKYGKATNPKTENVCRDQVLNIVRPKLEQFGVDLTLSEAQRAGGRRADILLATGAGRNLPIEAKRHTNTELWTAISEQLQDYADDPLADGFGIYLVFWIGLSVGSPPKAPVGTTAPSTAVELEKALVESMSAGQKEKIDVIVLDVAPRESR